MRTAISAFCLFKLALDYGLPDSFSKKNIHVLKYIVLRQGMGYLSKRINKLWDLAPLRRSLKIKTKSDV